jgi:SSS family transporter
MKLNLKYFRQSIKLCNFTPKFILMTPTIVALVLIAYFLVLIAISYFTSKNSDSNTFFTGNKQSPWYLVAFGMIGASLSGVTFISVPGAVINEGMAYFQVVLGYVIGYLVIAKILLPLNYKMNLISIYEYLQERLGFWSYKTGAGFFILSRTMGSAMRLYLATLVLQLFLFDDLGIPYSLTAVITIALIWVYTFKGGIKTIVYTDTFQTFFLITAVIICTVIISNTLGFNFIELYDSIKATQNADGMSLSKIFHFEDFKSTLFFPKQFIGGMFIALAMTGLDQDMMQKNLSCKSLKDAQKNMYSFTTVLLVVNFLFLLLGGALYVYTNSKGIDLPVNDSGKIITDNVFPTLALGQFGTLAGVFFLLGIIASSYSSADSALAALTTGFCIDFLNFHKRDEKQKQRYKLFVHIGFSVLFLLIVLIMKQVANRDLISLVFTVAGYTYGPLLGLFFFGILTKRSVKDRLVPIICILAPILCYVLSSNSQNWLMGYKFGYELLLVNGLVTFAGLFLISSPMETVKPNKI